MGFALWPALHHVWIQRTSADPWAFGGWSMYCVPKLEVGVGVVGIRSGQPVALQRGAMPPSVATRIAVFNRARRAMGTMLTPDPIARQILDGVPELDAVQIVVRQSWLDPRTGTIVPREWIYTYPRTR